MARKNILHLEGADELNKALAKLENKPKGHALREATEDGAEVIRSEAARNAPRDTGVLQENIEDQTHRLQIGRAQIDIGPARKAFYGRMIELGTSKMSAKPFLRPAFDTKKDDAIKAIGDTLKRILKL